MLTTRSSLPIYCYPLDPVPVRRLTPSSDESKNGRFICMPDDDTADIALMEKEESVTEVTALWGFRAHQRSSFPSLPSVVGP